MINLSVATIIPAQVQADPEHIAKVKRTVNGFGSDASVNVKFVDGSMAKGRITIIGDTSFVLVNKKTTDSVTISYAQVKEVRRAGENALTDRGMWLGIADSGDHWPLLLGAEQRLKFWHGVQND